MFDKIYEFTPEIAAIVGAHELHSHVAHGLKPAIASIAILVVLHLTLASVLDRFFGSVWKRMTQGK